MDVAGGLSLVQTVLQLLGSPILMKLESILGWESQLEKLKDTMSTIEAVLLDAEEQDQLYQHYRRSHVELNKLKRLKEALYRADDLFDEIATLAHRKKLMPCGKIRNKEPVSCFFSCSDQFCSAFNWSREREDIREMLNDIVMDHRQQFGFRHPVASNISRMSHYARETHSFVCEAEGVIIGRDVDKQMVIDMLLDFNAEEDVSFISIVGIGGLGKTSLTQLVYNDERVQRGFPMKIWVCVSDDFNVEVLLRKILAAASNPTDDNSHLNLDQLQIKLRQKLEGKKYVLVLDDVWNEDFNKWSKLRILLTKGGKGSKIIVTTRSIMVADIVGSHKIHELAGLSENYSWDLFQRMVSDQGQHQMKPHLVEIGKEIVQKCANVPLAIRVVGSLLRGQDESRWQYFRTTDLANIQQDGNGIVPVLKISYYNLPFHLKSCFSYCAIFPKDYKIVKEDLICLWMAQGFIKPFDGQSLEEAGNECFMNLLRRCFFQDVEQADGGEIISCKMHDLIHDVAKEVAGTEILSSKYSTSHFNEKSRHLFVDSTLKIKDIVSFSTKMKRMRTFLGIQNPPFSRFSTLHPLYSRSPYVLLKVLRYIRVLDLHDIGLKTLPNTIDELLHLRYLDLSANSALCMLPTSITKLYNLQTLKLQKCMNLKKLPKDLSKLVNLRHLDIHQCLSLTCMPPGMNNMTSLCKLTRFVGRVSELGHLKYITNHTDIMEIVVRKGVTYSAIEAKEGGYLQNNHKLREIDILWHGFDDKEGNNYAEARLQPHRNLTVLKLGNYPGVRFRSWFGSSMNLETCLPNLVKIELVKCKRLKHLPLLSQLRQLKVLLVEYLMTLEYVENRGNISEEGASPALGSSRHLRADELVFFPSLEKLELKYLTGLKGWRKTSSLSDSIEQRGEENQLLTSELQSNLYTFPRLSDLTIKRCSSLTTFPQCPKLEVLKIEVAFSNKLSFHRFSRSSFDGETEVEVDGINVGYIINSLPVKFFQCLTHLKINDTDNVEALTTGEVGEVFQSGRMSSLSSVIISDCKKLGKLTALGMWEYLTTLETLELMSLPELVLEEDEEDANSYRTSTSTSKHTAEKREIRFDDSQGTEVDMPWKCLAPTLRNLALNNLPKLVKLPKGMHHLASLHFLNIEYCDNLEALPPWMSCFSSLGYLRIGNCKRLKSLPEEMCYLASLRELCLWGCCSELVNRCQNSTGADWPKIEHIPRIEII